MNDLLLCGEMLFGKSYIFPCLLLLPGLKAVVTQFTENCHIYLKTFMDFFLSILSTVSQPTEIFPHDTLIVNTHRHTLCQLS